MSRPLIRECKSYLNQLYSFDKRSFCHQALSLCLIVASALMIWKGLIVWSGSESPVVVVLSGKWTSQIISTEKLFFKESN